MLMDSELQLAILMLIHDPVPRGLSVIMGYQAPYFERHCQARANKVWHELLLSFMRDSLL